MALEVSKNGMTSSGNTIPRLPKRNAFQLTLNEPEKYENIKDYITNLKTNDYFISCNETAPTTGHKHIHIYAHFNNLISLSIKKCCGAHIEVCKGSPKQNIDYIKKDGNIIDEIGNPPHQGSRTVKELHEANIEDIDGHLYKIKKQIDEDYNRIDTFKTMLEEIENDNLNGPEVYYITGNSGEGKTYKAYKLALEKFKNKDDIGKITINNNFLSIINPTAKCFVIEEFRDNQMYAANFLQMIDKYGYDAPIKGGHIFIRPSCFIIASIIPPEKIYIGEPENHKQFIRRITNTIIMENHKELEYI